ncbi:MAG: hypothetical protein A3K77_06155 [Euryarchaeota archaeon RBG_13_31_8]|nr:MAG: hypothetical protein A3K77_06155 [Euryarchaeota archaeon RBG_13_31_8]
MRKRMVGIFICMLLLTLPTIQGANSTFDKIAHSTKTNDNFYFAFAFVLFCGIIEYNGEVYDYLLGDCYNVTPIRVRCILIGFDGHYKEFQNEKITTDDTLYMLVPKDIINWRGFVNKHIMFLHVFEWVIEN